HSTRRYRLIKPLVRRIWNKVSYFCVQNKGYSERFSEMGIQADKLMITGNMKYDVINLPANERHKDAMALRRHQPPVNYREIFGFKPDDTVIIAGSTHPPEEEILINVYSELKSRFASLRLVIAPRHPFRFDEVDKIIRTKVLSAARRSALTATTDNDAVILLDTLGELNKVYQIADIVFVGGSMVQRGGQSILEPAAAGKPVIFGPDMSNFQDIADQLIKEEAAISVQDKPALSQALLSLINEPQRRSQIGAKARTVISRYQGATDKNMEFISKLVDPGHTLY
ncbi:MAG: glycosyltransferase N-terminal domain-containing protein, partial [Planctomycetota bacterium]